MTASSPRAACTWRRQLAPAAIVAVAAALGTLSHPALAHAEWDIGAYDFCMRDVTVMGGYQERNCCDLSGGVWRGGPDGNKCVAPSANEAKNPPAPQNPGRPVPVGPSPTAINPAP
jgi:hypothetical protein